jgi:hypothetical protein
MPPFNEHVLEMAIMELFKGQGYSRQSGETIHKELSDALLREDLRMFLMDRYSKGDITLLEVERVIAELTADNKSKYTDWSNRSDIKAELQMDLILILAEHGYPPVPQDEVFKEIFEQAENFKKYEGMDEDTHEAHTVQFYPQTEESNLLMAAEENIHP